MLELDDDVPADDRSFFDATAFLERNIYLFEPQHLLRFYGLYKQATVGPCNIPKPLRFSINATAKWFAWSEFKELSQESAKRNYVLLMNKVQPGWNDSQHNASSKREEERSDGFHSLLDYVKKGNAQEVREVIESGKYKEQLNVLYADGLGVIHWAANRGNADILQCLLNSVAIDVNLRGCEGHTALHFASCRGNMECIQLLLSHNADHTITDNDGVSCLDVALNAKIKSLLS